MSQSEYQCRHCHALLGVVRRRGARLLVLDGIERDTRDDGVVVTCPVCGAERVFVERAFTTQRAPKCAA